MSTAKKGRRQGPASRNSMYTGIPSQRTISQRQYSTKIIGKSHRKNPTFYVFTPWLFLYFVGIEEGRQRNFSPKNPKIDEVTNYMGKYIFTLDCNDMGARRFFFLQAHHNFLPGPCVPFVMGISLVRQL
jgi:hypothetical protein